MLLGTSMDEAHLIHKPSQGLGAGDLTGAMHVADALGFGGGGHGHSSPMVRKAEGEGGVCCWAAGVPVETLHWLAVGAVQAGVAEAARWFACSTAGCSSCLQCPRHSMWRHMLGRPCVLV